MDKFVAFEDGNFDEPVFGKSEGEVLQCFRECLSEGDNDSNTTILVYQLVASYPAEWNVVIGPRKAAK